MKFSLKKLKNIMITLLALNVGVVHAGLPFTKPLTTLQDAIAGPFLLAASVIMIVITCIMLAFGEWGDGFKKIINIVLWLSVAFGAVNFVTTMWGGGF